MDISGIIAAADPTGSKAANSQNQFGKDYNQFLKLLTTQLQNQDPLSPLDTAEFTSQLTQFSAVEQQIQSNDYLHKLLTLNTLSMTGVALGYVGLNVYSPGNEFKFDAKMPSDFSYSMPTGATSATLTIKDKSGTTVLTTDADKVGGQHNFSWDGNNAAGQPMTAGDYTVTVSAQDKDGKALSVPMYTSAIAEGVQTGEDGDVKLIINGKLVPLMDVRQAAIQRYALQAPATDNSGTNVATP
jgi:flagellar basal-body rod modification protein FlgD